MRSRSLALLLVLGLTASACEMVAGIGDRKLGTSVPGKLDGGLGGHSAGGTGAATGGAGGATARGGAGGSGGIIVIGGASGSGGVVPDGAAVDAAGAGGTGGVGGGGATGDGGMTSTGGTAHTGGITGQGGTKYDAGPDGARPDAAPDSSGCATAVQGTGNGLLGEYYASPSLSALVLTRLDSTIDFDWANAPDLGLPADGFSVRWTGQIQPRFSGRYSFYTGTDDGVRLWVNGTLVLQDWNDHSVTENTGAIDLVAGQKYDLKMEYYEAAGLAAAHLYWSSSCQPREVVPASQLYAPAAVCSTVPAGAGDGLVGEYFDNQDLSGLRLTRTDPTIAFAWPDGTSPNPTLAPGSYSVRWTGQIEARTSGFTSFYVVSDDGARLFLNDALVIDDWIPHGRTEDVATIATAAGTKYNVRLEYFEQSSGGQIQLWWGNACQSKELIPQTQLYTSYTGMVCTPPPVGTGTGLRGDYYDNQDLTNLVATHGGENVNFDWAMNAPDPKVGADTFSVRWTGRVLARYTGGTTFSTWSDDGARLWIDGQLIIDNWSDHQAAKNSGLAYLVAGQLHDVKLEFRENLENALIKLLWSSPCQPEEVVPASQLFLPGYVPPPDAGPDVPPDVPPDGPPDTPDANEPDTGELDAGMDS